MAHPSLPALLRLVWVAAVATLLSAGAASAVDGRRATTNEPTDAWQVASGLKDARRSKLAAVLVTCGVPAQVQGGRRRHDDRGAPAATAATCRALPRGLRRAVGFHCSRPVCADARAVGGEQGDRSAPQLSCDAHRSGPTRRLSGVTARAP